MRWLWLCLVVGCSGPDPAGTKPTTSPDPEPTTPQPAPAPTSAGIDEDGDGYAAAFDCDDTDPAVHPEATEIYYDGIDQNCDEASDYDADLDGFDSDDYGGTDCDDTDPAVSPDGQELCDGRDGDCDGTVDSPAPPGSPIFHLDADGDGYGGLLYTVEACDAPPGYVSDNTDCDDALASVHPYAQDVPCDGYTTTTATSRRWRPPGGRAWRAPRTPPSATRWRRAVCGGRGGGVRGAAPGHEPGVDLRHRDRRGRQPRGDPHRPRWAPRAPSQWRGPIRFTLRDLTIADGLGTTVGNEQQGGGLFLVDGAHVLLDGVVVEDNQAEVGRGDLRWRRGDPGAAGQRGPQQPGHRRLRHRRRESGWGTGRW